MKFERNAAISQGLHIPLDPSTQFLQFVADNVDHNIATIDGHGTFHGMGTIACLTPASQILQQRASIPRLASVSSREIVHLGKVNIRMWNRPLHHQSSLHFEPLAKPNVQDAAVGLDLLWKMAWMMEG
jgi:hypothetical protein